MIGLELIVEKSPNKSEMGLNGMVVNETKNTFVIDVHGKEKTIQKNQRQFIIFLDGKKVKVDGDALVARPEDRIKKKIKRWN